MIKIATTAFKVESFTLQDGTEIEVRSLNLRRLRKFMELIEKLQKIEKESEAVDIFLDAAEICLEQGNPELAADRERMEDVLDSPTMRKILEVAGGIKLDDPNQ